MKKLENTPRLLIAAPQGRCGKTTITVGLLAALTARGLKVQPFKKGPDFIDPSWLTRVAGRTCRNLDSYMMDRETVKASFATHSQGADISLIEGAMGLFDGVDLAGSGSAAEIAKTVQAPVILVVNGTRMTRSVAAMVQGYRNFDQEVNVAAVVLNNVARSRHENIMRSSIEEYCDIPVVGAMPRKEKYIIPDRHLGLIPAEENEALYQSVANLGEAASQYLDLDKILALAATAPALELTAPVAPALTKIKRPHEMDADSNRPQIGVVMDRSFSFYYPENLESLANAGADLVAIDAINDADLPPVDMLFIGGGFPDVMALQLEQNKSLRQQIKAAIGAGLPVYAESGGLVYLGRSILSQGQSYQMVGALPFDVETIKRPKGHGYMRLEVQRDNSLFARGTQLIGHEFHYTQITNLDRDGVKFAYRVTKGYGIDGEQDGLLYKNVFASYNHLHALAVPQWAANMVKLASKYRQ